MKTLFLVLFFTNHTTQWIPNGPYATSCEKSAEILNQPEFTMMYIGERLPDGRIIDHAEWKCTVR